MVDLKRVTEAKSGADKAKIAIDAITEAEKISQTKKGIITKEQFAEMLFPGIDVVKPGVAEPTLTEKGKHAPKWVHDLV